PFDEELPASSSAASTAAELRQVALDLAAQARRGRSRRDRGQQPQRAFGGLHCFRRGSRLEERQGERVEVDVVRRGLHGAFCESQRFGRPTFFLWYAGQQPERILVEVGRPGGG